MKLGIMQPYFLPYLGYWQLINAVNHFVAYIKEGWINRNDFYDKFRERDVYTRKYFYPACNDHYCYKNFTVLRKFNQ